MKMSELFVTPSLVEKYMYLPETAKEIEGRDFHEEKVYLKKDLIKVCSRMGWIDNSRMVKEGEVPVKVTENKNKSTTKLYTFFQTEPFELRKS